MLRIKEQLRILNAGVEDANVLTQRELAQNCIKDDVSDTTKIHWLSRWNSGHMLNKLSAETLLNMCSMLKCNVSELIGQTGATPLSCKKQTEYLCEFIKYHDDNGVFINALYSFSREHGINPDFMFETYDN